MEKLKPYLSALMGLFFLLIHSSGQVSSSGGDVIGQLTSLRPRTSNVSARITEDVLRSHARLKFLRGSSKLKGPQSPVSAITGEYVMDIQVGTPIQTFKAIADTGSDLIWIQCKSCSQCFNQSSSPFDPNKSSTYSDLRCSNKFCKDIPQAACSSNSTCLYQYEYGDQSTTTGALSSDTVHLTHASIPAFAFGCGTNNQISLQGQADGIVGLGRGPLSLPSQMSSKVSKKFSYCLATDIGTPKASTIVFGDSAVPNVTGLVYTPMVSNSQIPTFYYAALKDINVDGKQLKIPASTFAIDPSTGTGGIIFDSGTTITLLASAGYDILKKAVKSAIPYPSADGSQAGLDTCFDISGVSNPKFPTITFNFDRADFPLSLTNTFAAIDQEGNTICLAMANSNQELSVFGNIQQQGFQIIYDSVKSQLGWVASQC